ncbi:hydrolase 1, exosortase A system-associated [Glaciimonas sp. CA11.2]|uniref:hydrolase 1, exosortase A system-associated n=2 Tax=Glaciimonas sp. CA11.2 TaxID=3048601 RepID=UPI002AB35248|nr:hydrolase 1, exosortase A system-associated [Glaciimonas sp. CA11.2]MDY7544696.1 hydrolase 1, exosortase A system-associated [Glaciimonas sp. CA11.2]
MNAEDHAVRFLCHNDWLYGVLSMPEQAGNRGVVMLVGGPQYRAGSHRQFTLLSRYLASSGIATMRFDYRGMGDSEGDTRNFEDINDDIRCAIDHFIQSVPGMTEVVIWGLCDAASAALFYAWRDSRVTGLVLLNPWVRTESGLAKAHLKHYYFSRLSDNALWKKILTGKVDYIAAARSLINDVSMACFKRAQPRASASLPDRMFDGYSRFKGKVLLILSGDDLTASEFSDLVASNEKWRVLLENQQTQTHTLPGANHTFSTRVWRDKVGRWTKDWLQSW